MTQEAFCYMCVEPVSKCKCIKVFPSVFNDELTCFTCNNKKSKCKCVTEKQYKVGDLVYLKPEFIKELYDINIHNQFLKNGRLEILQIIGDMFRIKETNKWFNIKSIEKISDDWEVLDLFCNHCKKAFREKIYKKDKSTICKNCYTKITIMSNIETISNNKIDSVKEIKKNKDEIKLLDDDFKIILNTNN